MAYSMHVVCHPLLSPTAQTAFRQHLNECGVEAVAGLPESGVYLLADEQGLALAKTDITSPTDTTLAFDFQLNPDDSLTAPLLPAQTFYRCTHASRPHKRPVN